MKPTGLIVVFVMGWAIAGCVPGWVQEDSPTDEDLYAVYGVAGGDVFAVGANGTVLRRQNAKWHELDSGTEEDLYGVWGTSNELVVVVGDNCTALEYNGPIEPPEEGEPPPDLRELTVATCGDFRNLDGPTDGDRAFVVGERTLSQWYDGSGLGNGRDFVERMQGVSMIVNDEIHACGDYGAYYRKLDGSWSEREIIICGVDLVEGECPDGHEARPILWDVWVGSEGKGAVVGTFGGIWTIPPPLEGAWDMLATGFSTDLRAVHGYVDPNAKENKTTFYAVGSNGAMVRVSGPKIIREAPGTHNNLYGVWTSENGSDIYAVGEAGTIIHMAK
ncbi:MAG: hypothetical protein JRJ19_02230 [Deltaproteobacteria bacterium]|nr:hypothetical protein [Deltaproteobacteria bacterium]